MLLRLALFILVTSTISCNKNSTTANNNPPDTAAVEIATRVVAENLNFPWQLLWSPDNMLWMSERGGRISRVDPSSGAVTPVLEIDEVAPNGEGGLLGMVFYINGSQSNLYVAYDYDKGGDYTGKVVRYDYTNSSLTNPVTIIDDIAAAGIHNGCRLIVFPGDQKLYITTGDASEESNAQNLSSLNGKILRLNLDGSIPSDNPTPGSAVWSYGHRNPQGLVAVNNIIFSSEHGPSTDDEVNIIQKGGNYGWPHVRGFCNESDEQAFCNGTDIVEPLINWTPTIAVSGIDYYNSDSIPQWKNSILIATLKYQRLVQLKLAEDQRSFVDSEEFLINQYGRLRDVCTAPDGRVFICTSNGNNEDVIIEAKRK